MHSYLYRVMAALPVFYQDVDFLPGKLLTLNEDTAKHITQVLRMDVGESVEIANGKGMAATGVIEIAAKRKCSVRIGQTKETPKPAPALQLAIAFTKNTSRNEWLLEKATELGVQRIIPLTTERTERERFRYDRFQNILISAMMQSQQYWLPILEEAMPLETVLKDGFEGKILVAHCMGNISRKPIHEALKRGNHAMIFIGPEGDFSEAEVNFLMAKGAEGIILGNTRLRTETAAMAACAFFQMLNA